MSWTDLRADLCFSRRGSDHGSAVFGITKVARLISALRPIAEAGEEEAYFLRRSPDRTLEQVSYLAELGDNVGTKVETQASKGSVRPPQRQSR
jgi:hypothetical protein